MAYSAIYTSADLTSVKNAIITLATRESAYVAIDGRVVHYHREDLPFLRQLLADIQLDLAKAGDNGGLCLIQPGGRT